MLRRDILSILSGGLIAASPRSPEHGADGDHENPFRVRPYEYLALDDTNGRRLEGITAPQADVEFAVVRGLRVQFTRALTVAERAEMDSSHDGSFYMITKEDGSDGFVWRDGNKEYKLEVEKA
jgi:hypothetical protein